MWGYGRKRGEKKRWIWKKKIEKWDCSTWGGSFVWRWLRIVITIVAITRWFLDKCTGKWKECRVSFFAWSKCSVSIFNIDLFVFFLFYSFYYSYPCSDFTLFYWNLKQIMYNINVREQAIIGDICNTFIFICEIVLINYIGIWS